MNSTTIPPLLVALTIVCFTILIALDKVAGEVGLAAVVGLVGGTFVPSPLTKSEDK